VLYFTGDSCGNFNVSGIHSWFVPSLYSRALRLAVPVSGYPVTNRHGLATFSDSLLATADFPRRLDMNGCCPTVSGCFRADENNYFLFRPLGILGRPLAKASPIKSPVFTRRGKDYSSDGILGALGVGDMSFGGGPA